MFHNRADFTDCGVDSATNNYCIIAALSGYNHLSKARSRSIIYDSVVRLRSVSLRGPGGSPHLGSPVLYGFRPLHPLTCHLSVHIHARVYPVICRARLQSEYLLSASSFDSEFPSRCMMRLVCPTLGTSSDSSAELYPRILPTMSLPFYTTCSWPVSNALLIAHLSGISYITDSHFLPASICHDQRRPVDTFRCPPPVAWIRGCGNCACYIANHLNTTEGVSHLNSLALR